MNARTQTMPAPPEPVPNPRPVPGPDPEPEPASSPDVVPPVSPEFRAGQAAHSPVPQARLAAATGIGSLRALLLPAGIPCVRSALGGVPQAAPAVSPESPGIAAGPLLPGRVPAPPASGPQVRKIRVLLADSHPIVQEGLAALLARQPGMELLSTAGDGCLLPQSAGDAMPDVVMFDPEAANPPGLQPMLAVLAARPATRFIVFTSGQKEEDVYRAFSGGALGYLLKSAPVPDIVACIAAVSNGRPWISAATRAVLETRLESPELTNRELDVLAALAQGMSNREIGRELNLREGTVKVHVGHILGKLRADKRAEALSIAIARGLVSPVSVRRRSRPPAADRAVISRLPEGRDLPPLQET